MTTNWYQLDPGQAIDELKSHPSQGLSEQEATLRRGRYGPNELVERGLKNPWRILFEQLSGSLIVILMIAALISAWLGDNKDALAILTIVILNAALGFQQEYKAEQSMAALRRLAVPMVKVRRAGHVRELSARELVPGDVVLLETGNLASADGRLLLASNLRVQEAALTGESEPIEKTAEVIYETDLPLADRRNMVYMGTTITYGHGELLITATGMHTELGHIATMIQTVGQEQTPLQKRLDKLGRTLGVVALVIVAIIFILGLLRGEEIKLMFLTAVSMAVAAVPEGLPAVVTIALALGAQRMLKRRALIRKLPAVETLGSVTVICSDKTGTLTKNQMTVTVLDVAGHRLDLTSRLAEPILEQQADQPALKLLLAGAALCNDALLETETEGETAYRMLGDPTETALVLAAAQMGLDKTGLDRAFPRLAEVPFDSDRKRMTTIHQLPKGDYADLVDLLTGPPALDPAAPPFGLAVTKGALDTILPISDQVWLTSGPEPLSPAWRERILAAHDQLAQQGMRILSVGFRLVPLCPGQVDQLDAVAIEQGLIFVGLIGMIDPPRPEVKAAVEMCRTAGIRPVMITGDHPLTARYVAGQLGIDTHQHLTGQELNQLSTAELENVVNNVSLYARVSPEHKLNLIEALQKQGHIVAMTGDGVNDAPALKKADIGVAMGITGTDVSKEAADAVLLDDNFATIVAAVEEGRVIYDNIRKFIKYTMTSNSGEIWVMLLAPFIGMPLPLLPLQILWINLVTDGLPGLAFGVEPAERDTMRRPPYHPQENIFGRGMGWHIAWVGVLMGLVSLSLGWWMWRSGHPAWQTMVFTTLTLAQMGHALAIRSRRDSLFSLGLASNKLMLGAVLLTLGLQLAVIYVPFLQEIFITVPLSLGQLSLSLLLSSVVFGAVEVEKWVRRRSI